MDAADDPERWLSADEEVAKQLRPVLPMALGEGPTPSEHARMWSALVARVPALAAEGGGHTPTARTTATTATVGPVAQVARNLGWGWVAGTAVVATLFGFTLAMLVTRSTPVPRAVSGPPAAGPAAAVQGSPSAGPAAAVPGPPSAAPSAARAESTLPRSSASSPLAVAHPSPVSAAGDPGPTPRAAPAEPHAQRGARPAKKTRRPASLATAGPPPSAAESIESASDVGRELELLARARRVVASDPARALQLTAEHARRFADGTLAQEREVLAIGALSRLGHRDLAAARARRFIERYPDSAHRVRLAAELEVR
jgi:hypothetical protein